MPRPCTKVKIAAAEAVNTMKEMIRGAITPKTFCLSHGETVWGSGALACVYSIAESQQTLSAGLELLRSRKGHSIVEFIDNAAKQDIPIDAIKKQLHVA